MSVLPTTEVKLLGSDKVDSFKNVCAGKVGIIDFWHTKCPKCPAAIDNLNSTAEKFKDQDDVIFLSCALSQGAGNEEDVASLVSDWENMGHYFVAEDKKEEIKAAFQFNAVPFYVVFDKSGNIVKSGDPKSFNYLETVKETLNPPKIVLDEDF